MTFLSNSNEKKLLNILLLLAVSIFYYKIFIVYDHYPLHDEIIALDRYTEWKNFLRRNTIGNHTINSLIAVIHNSIFGYDFINLRLISFVSFVGILLVFRFLYNSVFLFLIFIIVLTSSNILFNYTYIFRGYYTAALLAILTFFYLKKYFYNINNIKNLRILLFLIFLQLFHSLFTIYIAIPSLIMILFLVLKRKIIKESFFSIFLFIILIILTYILFAFIDGFVSLHNSDLNFNFLFQNLFSILIPCIIEGLRPMFFNEYAPIDFFSLTSVFRTMYFGADYILVSEPVFLIIYLSSFLIMLFNLIKSKMTDYFSITMLLIFVFFIITFTAPPLRVHTGTIYFCLFYIMNYMDNFTFFKKKIISKLSFILCIFFITTVSPNNDFQQTKKSILKIDEFKSDCLKANKMLNQYEIWILINYYPSYCKYKYDSNMKINILFNLAPRAGLEPATN